MPDGLGLNWTAESPDSGEVTSGRWVPAAGRKSDKLKLTLRTQDDATYTAVFIDAESKQPLDGVRVVRFPGSEPLPRLAHVTPPSKPFATSGKDGTIRIKAATWRTCRLTVYAEGYAYAYVLAGGNQNAPGLQTLAQVPLQKEAAIQFTLLDAGEDMAVHAFTNLDTPGANTDVLRALMFSRVTFQSEPTGEEGVHMIRGLAPNSRVKLTLMEKGKKARTLPPMVSGKPGSVTQQIIDCWRRGVIEGTLKVAEGQSPEGRIITLTEGRPGGANEVFLMVRPLASAEVSASGQFRFEGLAIRKYYAHVTGSDRQGALPDQVSAPIQLTITSERPRANVDLVEVTGGYLSGVLRNGRGDPCTGQVTGAGPHRTVSARAGAKGAFRLGPFHLESTVKLWAIPDAQSWRNARTALKSFRAPTENIELAFLPAGKVEGRVLGLPSRERVQFIDLGLRRDGRLLAGGQVKDDGTFSIGHLTAGKYFLDAILSPTERSLPVEVEVRAGEITDGAELNIIRH